MPWLLYFQPSSMLMLLGEAVKDGPSFRAPVPHVEDLDEGMAPIWPNCGHYSHRVSEAMSGRPVTLTLK